MKNIKFGFRPPPTLTTKGVLPFVMTLFIVLVLLTMQLLSKYSEDIFGKGIDNVVIAQFVILGTGILLLFALPYPIIISSVLLYRRLFREKTHIYSAFRRDIKVVVIFSLLTCLFAAFIQPRIKLSFHSLLFDVKRKAPDDQLVRTDISIFKGSGMTENIIGIIDINDSLNTKIENRQEELIKSLKTNASPERLDSLVTNSDLSEVGLTANEILTYEADWDGSGYSDKRLATTIKAAELEIRSLRKKLKDNNYKIGNMFFIPISLLLLFVLSIQIGIINHRIKLPLLIISLCFSAVPIWYYLTHYIDDLIKEGVISILVGKLGLLLILLVGNFGLFYLRTRNEIIAVSSENNQ